ncbi:hypothetical protein RJT34_01663 [Clitoria ternatea]|uniref:RNase H type-1 domain-containing protein n=1 Tax=Clitoria ternatea TaxID=43366 RepID=A0AAN9Q3F8_CLITE
MSSRVRTYDHYRVIVDVAWTPPSKVVLKLNVDRFMIWSSLQVAHGGLLQNLLGQVIKCFTSNLGFYTFIKVEMLGLLKGLKLFLYFGIQRLEVEVDSKIVVNFYVKHIPRLDYYFGLVQDLKFSKFISFDVVHIRPCLGRPLYVWNSLSTLVT